MISYHIQNSHGYANIKLDMVSHFLPHRCQIYFSQGSGFRIQELASPLTHDIKTQQTAVMNQSKCHLNHSSLARGPAEVYSQLDGDYQHVESVRI